MLTDEMRAVRLSPKQKAALIQVCRTNGGGIRVHCKVNDDGITVPINRSFARLFDLGLIQGKSGAYETVVHTRDGLAVCKSLTEPKP